MYNATASVTQKYFIVSGIVTLHSAEAADGQQPEGILGLLRLLVPDQRPHADGKLVDPHAAELGGQEVAQLVDGDQYAENQNGRQARVTCRMWIVV